jgi:hypothetical protein
MHRTTVASDNLASISYDASDAVLEIEFRNGRVYDYLGVPEDVFRGLMSLPRKDDTSSST